MIARGYQHWAIQCIAYHPAEPQQVTTVGGIAGDQKDVHSASRWQQIIDLGQRIRIFKVAVRNEPDSHRKSLVFWG
jgi:hypothetical protein